MAVYPGLSDTSDYVREILNVVTRAAAEAATLDGAAGLSGELAEIESLSRRLLAQLED